MTANVLSAFLHVFLFQSRRGYDDDADTPFFLYLMPFIVALFCYVLYKATRDQLITTAHWSHNFDDLQMSSQEFYASLEKSITEVQIPDLSISRVVYAEEGILSSRREYLRIYRKDLLFDVCAAPLGKGYFISWWQADQENMAKNIVRALPLIGRSLERHFFPLTYYRIDTQEMFKAFFQRHLLAAVDAIIAQKGLRGLTEEQRRPIAIRR